MQTTITPVGQLEDNLTEAIAYQDWVSAAATAAEIVRTSDDWNERERYTSLAQTYATLAQAAATRISNQVATERANVREHQQAELNSTVAAIAVAARESAMH